LSYGPANVFNIIYPFAVLCQQLEVFSAPYFTQLPQFSLPAVGATPLSGFRQILSCPFCMI